MAIPISISSCFYINIFIAPLITDHILYIIEGVIPFIDALFSEQDLMVEMTSPNNLLNLLIVSY